MFDPEKFGAAVGASIREAVDPLLKRVEQMDKDLEGMAAQLQAEVVAFSAEPVPGPPGAPGLPGKDAEPVDTEALAKEIAALIPAPADGPPGKDGASVTLEDVQTLLEPEFAKWALDFERRAHETLQKTIDRFPKPKDGEDGKDGIDAIGFDDLTVEHDGARSFTLKFVSGERVKEFAFSVPVVIDAGYYREGEAYEKGDGVTFGGSYWIAQALTRTKPEIGNDEWRLAVKKGRDAKTPASLEAPK